MTEFEFIEATTMSVELARGAAMDFVTLFFAYSLCAHFVGKGLPKLIALTITFVYTIFLINPLLGMATGVLNYVRLSAAGLHSYPNSPVFQGVNSEIQVLLTTILPALISWMFSIIYMHVYIRRTEED